MTNLGSILESRDITNKCPSRQSYGFSSSHVWMWQLDHKESWVPKNWCFSTVVLEKIPESSLDCKQIKPVNPKGNQSCIFIERSDAEAEISILRPPDAKKWLIWKDPDPGKDWRQEEKGTIEDEMIGWHHWIDGHEFEKAAGAGDGQGGLECCSPWGHRIRHDWVTELNWTGLRWRHSWPWTGEQAPERRQKTGMVFCLQRGEQTALPSPTLGSLNARGKEEGFVEDQWHSQLVSAPYPVLQNPHDEWMCCLKKVNLPSVSPVWMKRQNSWEDFPTKNAQGKRLQRQDDSNLSNHRCSSCGCHHSHLQDFSCRRPCNHVKRCMY